MPESVSAFMGVKAAGEGKRLAMGGLRFFSRILENDFPNDNPNLLAQALSLAKVLQVTAADQHETWYTANATILKNLFAKGYWRTIIL
ncbi:hypothetical protein HYPSUDRAFT_202441 [Hypholoma sublateritium FD-334 SS-4]|uniref:Uncharacterized protein n=1 Tax=Hypholoma sublateritium (strain FD-334 SS-4) TaxID=945553 RepID=A0A0D2PQV2_HYPSF|nr:hypothetical protein HYPSUDRAFT_202441 [Hypholoma sublateritium FD-334 SS-4]